MTCEWLLLPYTSDDRLYLDDLHIGRRFTVPPPANPLPCARGVTIADAREELFGLMDAANIDLKGFYGGLLQDPLHSCA